MSKVDEKEFESFICEWLVDSGGYTAAKVGTAQGLPTDFHPDRALDTAELFAFIGATQAEKWHELRMLYGDPDRAQRGFAVRLAKELDGRGTVDVLRHGVVDLGVTIRLAFFRPASELTSELVERYAKNRLTVTRQLPYEQGSTKTLDVCLFVNGIPVATAELKNAITGQSIDDAIDQYRTSRDPKNPLLRRAVVHFAVDTERVAMTTRLAGKATRSCLSTGGTTWARAIRRTPQGTARRTYGSGCGSATRGWTYYTGSCTGRLHRRDRRRTRW